MIIEERLKMQEGFSDVEKAIANYILGRGEKLKNESARYVARQVYTSASSVTRLCQRLGLTDIRIFGKRIWKRRRIFVPIFRE